MSTTSASRVYRQWHRHGSSTALISASASFSSDSLTTKRSMRQKLTSAMTSVRVSNARVGRHMSKFDGEASASILSNDATSRFLPPSDWLSNTDGYSLTNSPRLSSCRMLSTTRARSSSASS